MPSRIVRASILDSDRYHSVDIRARLAFLEMILCADDYGLLPLTPVYLRRHLTALEGCSAEVVATTVSTLQDADLIRCYSSPNGGQYGYIPRFRNWPRSKKPLWPMPPEKTGGNEIKELIGKVHSRFSASAPRMHTETETETETETVNTKSTPLARSDSNEATISQRELVLAGADAPPRTAASPCYLDLRIPIVGGEFPVPSDFAAELGVCFPAVDVDQTLREIRAWNLANPTRRKTARGVRRHITNWFQRVQDS